MKISLSWVLAHIDNPTNDLDPYEIYKKLNEKTTEIEVFTHYTINTEEYECIQIKEINKNNVVGLSCNQKEYVLDFRPDSLINQWYLIRHDKLKYQWVSIKELGSSKDGFMPPINPESFTKTIYQDWLLTIDNKAITHRPDLWGHRGFAREVAALFDLSLKEIETMLAPANIHSMINAQEISYNGITIRNTTPACNAIAVCSINLTPEPCNFYYAHLLTRIDLRPINFIVDMTNYVMADLGHPMHAFDQAKFDTNCIEIRMAREKETMTLLDSTTISLSPNDIVITNTKQPLSLAGIMGGKESGIKSTTNTILIEAAHFNGTIIRKSSNHHKKRTEASTRFEKELDPNTIIIALRRFLYLLNKQQIFDIIAIKNDSSEKKITLAHKTIITMIGMNISEKFIITTLQKLGYTVTAQNNEYTITIPSFRINSERITDADIIEEIARIYGYNTIIPTPAFIKSHSQINKTRKIIKTIKDFSALSLKLNELNNYAFFDQSFINQLSFTPEKTLSIENPVSENWKFLNNSHFPHLLKAISDNAIEYTQLGFFEITPLWINRNNEWIEEMYYSASWYDQSGKRSFYEGKADLEEIFKLHGITVTWEKIVNEDLFWFEPYQSADLIHNNILIGHAGLLNNTLYPSITKYPKSSIFLATFSCNWYIKNIKKVQYNPIGRYQRVHRDKSLFVPLTITFEVLKNSLISLSPLIESIELIEFLEKPEWKEHRALTLRISLRDKTKTLNKDAIDQLVNEIDTTLLSHNITIR